MWSLVNWLLLQNILNIRKNNRDSQGMSNNNSPFYYPIEGDGAWRDGEALQFHWEEEEEKKIYTYIWKWNSITINDEPFDWCICGLCRPLKKRKRWPRNYTFPFENDDCTKYESCCFKWYFQKTYRRTGKLNMKWDNPYTIVISPCQVVIS